MLARRRSCERERSGLQNAFERKKLYLLPAEGTDNGRLEDAEIFRGRRRGQPEGGEGNERSGIRKRAEGGRRDREVPEPRERKRSGRCGSRGGVVT